ncbi:MAG TPA: extracellular solute-binding protein, partial [Chloroflexota bacterium]|nr:extracellular solute-binding protein [Chloroflexota bacterium]
MKALTPPVTRRRWGTQLAAGGVAAVLLACDQLPGGGGRSGASKGCTQPMELLVPWPDTDPVHAGLKKTIDDFVAVHPQCPIQPSVVSPWSAERLTTSIAAGSPPPLTALMPNTVSNWGPMGLLEPLDEPFKGAKLTAADFFPPVWETMSWQDRVWHVPLQVDPNFPLFWNKAMLREAGLNPDTPPTTIDELDQAAQALNRDVGGRWERIAFAPWLWYGLSNAMTTTAYM